MKLKYILALTATLATSQAFALWGQPAGDGCDSFGNCIVDQSTGGSGPATYLGPWMAMGSHWDSFVDADGEWDIETKPDGTQVVYFWDNEPKKAQMYKKAGPGIKKRSQLVIGPLSASLSKAQIKQKAEAEAKANAAKAAGAAAAGAAAQAASQKAAADAAANKAALAQQAAAAQAAMAIPAGTVINSQPLAVGTAPIARRKP